MKIVFFVLAVATIGLCLWPACSVWAEEGIVEWDKPPEIIGGMTELQKNIIYPESALKDSMQGMVLVSVEIRADGNLGKVGILEGVRGDLDQAAQNAVQKTRWNPAEKDGKTVSCTVTIPIQFKLKSKK